MSDPHHTTRPSSPLPPAGRNRTNCDDDTHLSSPRNASPYVSERCQRSRLHALPASTREPLCHCSWRPLVLPADDGGVRRIAPVCSGHSVPPRREDERPRPSKSEPLGRARSRPHVRVLYPQARRGVGRHRRAVGHVVRLPCLGRGIANQLHARDHDSVGNLARATPTGLRLRVVQQGRGGPPLQHRRRVLQLCGH